MCVHTVVHVLYLLVHVICIMYVKLHVLYAYHNTVCINMCTNVHTTHMYHHNVQYIRMRIQRIYWLLKCIYLHVPFFTALKIGQCSGTYMIHVCTTYIHEASHVYTHIYIFFILFLHVHVHDIVHVVPMYIKKESIELLYYNCSVLSRI